MKKTNVQKLEKIAADFLQYRYRIYLIVKKNHVNDDADYLVYSGATKMIEAIGGEWKRIYHGKENNQDELNNINNYEHIVWFPTDSTCENLNLNVWK